MRWLMWAFWGVVTGVDGLAILLIVTMMLDHYSVMMMLWDHTGSVWYFVAGGAMLGISFGISTHRNTKIKIPRRVRTGAVSHYQSIPPHLTCQGKRG